MPRALAAPCARCSLRSLLRALAAPCRPHAPTRPLFDRCRPVRVFDIFDGGLETACGLESAAELDYVIISYVLIYVAKQKGHPKHEAVCDEVRRRVRRRGAEEGGRGQEKRIERGRPGFIRKRR